MSGQSLPTGIPMNMRSVIRRNAELLDSLHREVHRTFRAREQSPAARQAWQAACSAFHAQQRELFYPGGHSRWTAFRHGHSGELETAIELLPPEIHSFGSGYLKEVIWQRLKRACLSAEQLRRIDTIALSYLDHRLRREFWSMCRYAVFRGSQRFWDDIERMASKGEAPQREKAGWLLAAKRGIAIRRRVEAEFARARFDPDYRPALDLSNAPR